MIPLELFLIIVDNQAEVKFYLLEEDEYDPLKKLLENNLPFSPNMMSGFADVSPRSLHEQVVKGILFFEF